jgi:hypothetical protein
MPGRAGSWSRRALLTGAAGSAAALASNALVPAAALAGTDGDVVLGADNASTAPTTITNSTADTIAFRAKATGEGGGVVAESENGVGLRATVTNPNPMGGSQYGILASVEGDGQVGIGISGYGETGVAGSGVVGVIGGSATIHGAGVVGYGEAQGCGVYGAVGGAPPLPAANVGVQAVATESVGTALRVDGKVRFSRSGRLAVSSGRTSVTRTLAGVTTSSIIIAVLQQAESGTWIRAAVPGSGKFTVYFNRALPSSSVVGWFVIN